MATIKLYKSGDNNFWLDVTYTINNGCITITDIVGQRSSGYGYGGYCEEALSHEILGPGCSGYITTNAGSYSGGNEDPKCGVGSRYGGFTWGFSSITLQGEGTGKISITINSFLSNYSFYGTYTSVDDITIPPAISSPTISTLSFSNITPTSITVSFSVVNNGGANISACGIGIRSGGNSGVPYQWIYDTTGIFTGLSPNTTYEFIGWATNHPDGLNRPEGTRETYSSWTEQATTTITPNPVSSFNIKTPSNEEIVLNYTLPISAPSINKLFGKIKINSKAITQFNNEIAWREESPGPCFVLEINEDKIFTIKLLEDNALKEGDKIEVQLLTGIDYEGIEYFIDNNENWVKAELDYQSSPWIFISPFGTGAQGELDWIETEMIILTPDGFKTNIKSQQGEVNNR